MSDLNSKENLKITYFLGAGASYNSIPIWKGQGESMINGANWVIDLIKNNVTVKQEFPKLSNNSILIDFFTKLKYYGILAIEYGSIDIYAKRLYLLNQNSELNELKKCLSVYFDLWENFLHEKYHLYMGTDVFQNDRVKYVKIDKRYLALLSVILEKGNNFPAINPNISFVTWNYDLQLESAFESFLPRKSISLEDTNKYLNFMSSEVNSGRKEVLHLNGFRGYFSEANKTFDTVERKNCSTIEDYLNGFLQNYTQFKNPDYNNSIKYAWELSSESLRIAKEIMGNTNILIIIGYSFPAFNRAIDSQLIKEFENGEGHKEVIYQDPGANQDIVNSLFSESMKVKLLKENTNQFYIPHEFLFSSL